MIAETKHATSDLLIAADKVIYKQQILLQNECYALELCEMQCTCNYEAAEPEGSTMLIPLMDMILRYQFHLHH
jgi:hypothetical protein